MPQTPVLDIAVTSPLSARLAVEGGADRLGVCEALEVGGLTPSPETIDAVLREADDRSVQALVRPRPGNFYYDQMDADIFLNQAERLAKSGVQGLVIGALQETGGADVRLCAEAIDRAKAVNEDIQITFHRAIDLTRDPLAVLDQLRELPVDRILTSGGADSAVEGMDTIGRMVRRAAGRLEIVAGGGMRLHALEAALKAGVKGVHFSAKMPHAKTYKVDVEQVRRLRKQIDKLVARSAKSK